MNYRSSPRPTYNHGKKQTTDSIPTNMLPWRKNKRCSGIGAGLAMCLCSIGCLGLGAHDVFLGCYYNMSLSNRTIALGVVAAAGIGFGLYAYFLQGEQKENNTDKNEKRKYCNWMRRLPGRKLISEVNLPGTHDSAAIRLVSPHKLDRQLHSITEQLLNGIRVLDVRIAIMKGNSHFFFHTTHGSNGPLYQSLISLLDECKDFLHIYKSEFLVLNLQIDAGEPSDDALAALLGTLNDEEYPLLRTSAQLKRLPKVAEARGKIVLLNRINDNYDLGIPLMQWVQHQNCEFLVANNASRDGYNIYVQDKFTDFKTHNRDVIAKKKFKYYLVALEKFTEAHHTSENGEKHVLINYVSVSDKEKVVNVKPVFLNHVGSTSRTPRLGWIMFDFPWDTIAKSTDGQDVTVIDYVVQSNFKYEDLPQEFSYVR